MVRFHLAPRTSPADHEAPGAKDRATFDRYACQRPNGRIASRTSGAPITVLNSSVVGNSASCAGGGISIGSSLTVRNSTISGNSTDAEGGGIFQSAGPDATFTMVNSTVTGNDTSSDNAGGGIQFFGAATIVYSTIVNNTATNEAKLSGYTGDPGLAALASNGGPTETREPLSGSPLVDAIPTGVVSERWRSGHHHGSAVSTPAGRGRL